MEEESEEDEEPEEEEESEAEEEREETTEPSEESETPEEVMSFLVMCFDFFYDENRTNHERKNSHLARSRSFKIIV